MSSDSGVSPSSRTGSRRGPRLLLLAPLAFLAGCALLLLSYILISRTVDPVERSSDCGRVARAFVDALMEGDARMVRALSVSDAGIDHWMTTRRGDSCPLSWDDETSTGLVCGVDERQAPEKWSCGFSYACIRRDYYFRVEAVELEQTPEGCRVTYWSEPRESDLP